MSSILKKCSTCHIEKPLGEFWTDNRQKDNKMRHCIMCCKAYYQSNKKEKAVARSKAYNQANKEKLAEYAKAYRQNSKEKIAEYRKAYYQANRETILERQQRYRDERKQKE